MLSSSQLVESTSWVLHRGSLEFSLVGPAGEQGKESSGLDVKASSEQGFHAVALICSELTLPWAESQPAFWPGFNSDQPMKQEAAVSCSPHAAIGSAPFFSSFYSVSFLSFETVALNSLLWSASLCVCVSLWPGRSSFICPVVTSPEVEVVWLQSSPWAIQEQRIPSFLCCPARQFLLRSKIPPRSAPCMLGCSVHM